MDKTIVVVSETRVPHPVYKKIMRKSVRFKAHDERNEANVGDSCASPSAARCRRQALAPVDIVERAK